MRRALRTTVTAVLSSVFGVACLFPTSSHESSSGSTGACTIDLDCGSSSSSCRQVHCVAHQCVEDDTPEGVVAPNFTGAPLECQKVVCDGKGSTKWIPDPTALPTENAPACKKYSCDASGNKVVEANPQNVPTQGTTPCKKSTCDDTGNVVSSADPTNVPPDFAGDCKVDQCSASGEVTHAPDPTDVPKDTRGDCMKDACTASGNATKVVDDTDVPPNATCFSYACSNGTPKGTPINPTTNCSSMGFVCGADGQCATCPAVDAACTDPGPGSRNPAAAHDFAGIGRTDSGGRDFCGAVPVGQAAYYTYYDDGTGFLASFDPYFEIKPTTAAAKMCVHFDCATIACPGGTTSDTANGHPGCCWDAAPGAFTGHRIDFCSGARVAITISSTAACTGYEAHFHD